MVDTVDAPPPVAKCDLHLAVEEPRSGSATTAEFGYATDIFDETTVRRFAAAFTRVLATVVTRPDVEVGAIDILSSSERADLVPVSGRPMEPAVALPRLLARGATIGGDAVAVVCGDERLTYRELDSRSNRLARRLIDLGAGPETVVAVALTRSVESVLALWAVAKTGAAFLAVDPKYPSARIAHMIEDSDVTLCVTVGMLHAELPPQRWVVLDDAAESAAIASHSDRASKTSTAAHRCAPTRRPTSSTPRDRQELPRVSWSLTRDSRGSSRNSARGSCSDRGRGSCTSRHRVSTPRSSNSCGHSGRAGA